MHYLTQAQPPGGQPTLVYARRDSPAWGVYLQQGYREFSPAVPNARGEYPLYWPETGFGIGLQKPAPLTNGNGGMARFAVPLVILGVLGLGFLALRGE